MSNKHIDESASIYSYGTIKGTNISLEEVEKYNDDDETGKWKVFYMGREAGVLIATGHRMMPSEFEVASTENLGNVLLDFKFYLNNIAKEENYTLSFEDNKMLFDDEEVAEFENAKLVKILDDDLLGYFISDMSSYAQWADEPENEDRIFILNNADNMIYDSFIKEDFKGNESIIEMFTKKENWVLEAYAKENLHEENDYIDFLSKMNFKLIENDKLEINDTFLNKIVENFEETQKPIKKTNRMTIVEDFNIGVEINDNFNEWNSIKNEDQSKVWKEKALNFRTGTYDQFDLLDMVNKLKDDSKEDTYLEKEFKKELKSLLKSDENKLKNNRKQR